MYMVLASQGNAETIKVTACLKAMSSTYMVQGQKAPEQLSSLLDGGRETGDGVVIVDVVVVA